MPSATRSPRSRCRTRHAPSAPRPAVQWARTVLVMPGAERDAGRRGRQAEWTEAYEHNAPGDGKVFGPLA